MDRLWPCESLKYQWNRECCDITQLARRNRGDDTTFLSFVRGGKVEKVEKEYDIVSGRQLRLGRTPSRSCAARMSKDYRNAE